MGNWIKIKGLNLSYNGTKILILDKELKTIEHIDYFDFYSRTFLMLDL